VEIVSDGNRLRAGSVIPEEPRGLAVLLHGIPSTAPSAPGDAGYPALAQRFALGGWAALWVDMRGVRASEGFFSIEGWVRDATTALDVARADPELHDLPAVFVGSSAGGAVATVATRRGARVDGLALLAAPASWVSFGSRPDQAVARITGEAGMTLAPEVLQDPDAWAAEFRDVTTVGAIGDLDIPILVLHGTADTVVPIGHAEVIARAAPHAEVQIFEGAEHQLRRDERAVDAVLAWMDRVLT